MPDPDPVDLTASAAAPPPGDPYAGRAAAQPERREAGGHAVPHRRHLLRMARAADRLPRVQGPRPVRARAHRQALNFQLTMLIGYMIGLLLAIFVIGVLPAGGGLGGVDRLQHPRGGRGEPGRVLHVPAEHQVRELRPEQQRRTTASASNRPRRVSTRRPASAARPSTRPSAMSPATTGARRRPAPTSAARRRSGAEQHVLGAARLLVESLAAGRRGDPGREALRVGGGMLDVPPAHAADVAVRSGSDAPPVLAGPVGEVVARPVSHVARPVADLVPVVPGGGERRVRELVQLGREVVVGLRHLAFGDLAGQLRARLDDERVGARGDRAAARSRGRAMRCQSASDSRRVCRRSDRG